MIPRRRFRRSLGQRLAAFGVAVTCGLGLCVTHTDTPDQAAADPRPLVLDGGWVPVDCADRPFELRQLGERLDLFDPESWRVRERAIREATPGDPLYVPYPFPTTAGEVAEDFEHGFFDQRFTHPPSWGSAERRVYSELADGDLTFEVTPVTNWSSSRCTRLFEPHLFLVRLFDEDGVEKGRGVLHGSGHFMTFWPIEDRRLAPVVGTEEVLEILHRLGVDGATDPQLVDLDGLHGICSAPLPCAAARAGDEIYVVLTVSRTGVYRIGPDSRRLSIAAFGARRREQGMDLGGSDWEKPFLTIGWEWARAERIADLEEGEAGSWSGR